MDIKVKSIYLTLLMASSSATLRDVFTIQVQDHCNPDASIILINDSNAYGFITDSPIHHYEPNRTCRIRLEAEPKKYHLTLRFVYLDVYSKTSDCNEDYVSITGERSTKKYCGSYKPDVSIYSSSNSLNITFHVTPDSPVEKYLGFRISYTRYHTDRCSDSEYRCWFQDRCIPEVLRCNSLDNCGDFSDERYCSAISAIGTVVLASCISIALLMVMILLCICVIKVLFGKKRRERRSSSTSVPVSNIEQLNQNAGVTCAGVSMPQAAPGTANPYNEPPPSYYYVHYTRTDEKDEDGSVSINPSSAPTAQVDPSSRQGNNQVQGHDGNVEGLSRPSTISDGRYETVNSGFVGDDKCSL